MAIEDMFDRSVKVQRLVADGSIAADGEKFEDYISNVGCHIQPIDEAFTEDLSGGYGKDWLMFCGVCDILEGDRVVDGSVEYLVAGVESFAFLGQQRHMEVRLRRFAM